MRILLPLFTNVLFSLFLCWGQEGNATLQDQTTSPFSKASPRATKTLQTWDQIETLQEQDYSTVRYITLEKEAGNYPILEKILPNLANLATINISRCVPRLSQITSLIERCPLSAHLTLSVPELETWTSPGEAVSMVKAIGYRLLNSDQSKSTELGMDFKKFHEEAELRKLHRFNKLASHKKHAEGLMYLVARHAGIPEKNIPKNLTFEWFNKTL